MPEEQKDLRAYILGEIIDEKERQAVEERLMTDEDFFRKLSLVEENLIQEYADGNLTAAERAKFEKRFPASEENRQKVRFARALRKYVDETETLKVERRESRSIFDSLKAFFQPPITAAFALLLILSVGGFFIWKSFRTNEQESLIALNKAYRAERPLESRITGLDYAPAKNTRGADDKTDKVELELAKTLALKSVSENPSAENLHALGKVYLTQKLFDEAIEQFQKSLAIAPQNPAVHNDLGVAFMEKAQLLSEGKLENLSDALKEFKKALELNPAFTDALFNKAVCLELIPMPNQAKTAWSEYLKTDSTSPWADEARRHLEKLDTQSNKELSSAEFEQKFFESYLQKNDDELWRLISRNRELIKLKYLPQRLGMTYVESAGEDRKKTLDALKHLGDLEKDRLEDFFASDLAAFYEKLPEEKIETLKEAYASMRRGYEFCLNGKHSAAIIEFTKASELFISTGNFLEANAICRHFIAYCLYNTDRRKEAIKEFEQVKLFCERHQYKWLQLATSYWLTGWSADSFDFHSSEKAKQEYLNGLKISEKMGDFYYIQKYLQTLATRSRKLGQEKEMMFYLQKLFEISDDPVVSLRQKFRNYATGLRMLASSDFESLAKEVASEELNLANESGENFYITTAYIDSGIVQTQADNFSEAKEMLSKARKTAEFINEKSQKEDLLADIFLKTGNLESKKNNYEEAVKYYDESLKIVEAQQSPTLLYELSKQRLAAYQHLGNDDEVGKQIPEVLRIAEKYRAEILEEKERNSFFDNEQTVYDIAIEHELRSSDTKKAFDYSEKSNSRSLLDWLHKGINKSDTNNEIVFNESTDPFTIEEIQARMPSEVQILQYTILEKKILLWIITKETVNVVSSEIKSQELDEKVKNYLNLIQSLKAENQSRAKTLGRELYNILITPILPYLDKNKEICLIPNKSLFQMPFAALVSPGEDYFVTEFDFFYVPSASVFILCTENASKKQPLADERFLGIGNPSFNRKKFPDLQQLPISEKEVDEISSFYQNPKILPPKQSTKKSVTDIYRNFEVIHFAGHYIVQHSSPLTSGLVLADDGDNSSVLTNYELAGDNLANAKLVVLSACQTGVEGYYSGEGLIGLSRTFLASGVPLVIASQWKVDSDAAAELMENFHRYRRQKNFPTVKALRQAQIDMLKSENKAYSSPYYWAAFAGFGGYTNF